ncbi:S-layer homology domain-containing protein [Salibacterium aidingense]|uniref:S-layer homology domain-containing protein n=1 Tax=Salibacterium aidingense TaxID=384933 RepID=UPI003BD74A18
MPKNLFSKSGKLGLLLLVCFSYLITPGFQSEIEATTSAWESVGNEGFSDGTAQYTDIDFDDNNIPYVAYMDGSQTDRATVKKFNGDNWETVGSPGFTPGTAAGLNMSIGPDGTPYVLFKDGSDGNSASVMKYNGSSWEVVGNYGFSDGTIYDNHIAVDHDGNVYVLYVDSTRSYKLVAKKFNGTTWETVGSDGFSSSNTSSPSITFDTNNTPYVVYSDSDITVKKFNGSTWGTVGNSGIADGFSQGTDIAIDSNNQLYVAYLEDSTSEIGEYKSTVKTFDGSWQTVGEARFSERSGGKISIAMDNNDEPSVVYTKDATAQTLVQAYDSANNNWEGVGGEPVSSGTSNHANFVQSADDNLYVVFMDGANDNRATVKKTYTKYVLSYNGNGHESGDVPSDQVYDSNSTASVEGNANNLTRSGYSFLNWNTKSDGSGTSFNGGDELPIGEEDVTLFAQWINNNANLSDVTLSTGTLDPTFKESTTNYNMDVTYAESSITVTPTAADANATVTVNGETITSGQPSSSIDLDPGNNDIAIQVTAQDGSTKTYTITVNRTKSELLKQIEEAEGIANEDYTEDSWTALQNAISDAEDLLNNDDATPTEIDSALDALQAATDGLVKNPPTAESGRFIEGGNTLMIDFGKAVMFDLGEGESENDGFTVMVDGTGVTDVTAAVYDTDSSKVILTLPAGTGLSTEEMVHVDYVGAEGHLKGDEADGTAVEDFSFEAEDPFAAALKITSPKGNTTEHKPTVTGEVYVNSDALVVTVKDSGGNPVDADGTLTWASGDSSWSYEVGEELELGDYTVEARATDDERSVTKTQTFTIGDELKLEKVTVHDKTPDKGKLTFNIPVKEDLAAVDFASFEMDGRTVTDVKEINGNEVIVELNESFAPSNSLDVGYDEMAEGSAVVSRGEGSTELSTITPENTEAQADIEKANHIIPLEIVTTFLEDGEINIIFNKPINEEATDLSGLTFGGVPVQDPFEINGNELSFALPEGADDNTLAYDADLDNSHIEENLNSNNQLGDLIGKDAIDLGETPYHVNESGRLTDQIGIMDGNSRVIASESFDGNQPSGYEASVPNDVNQVELSPAPAAPIDKVVKVHVNGIKIADWGQLPLEVGENTITVGIYDADNPHVLLGQYQFDITRKSSSSGSGGSGGGGGTSEGEAETEVIEVDVAIGGEAPTDITRIPIERTTEADGTITDDVTFTKEQAEEIVDKAKETGENIARIIIPDENDEVSEVHVDIPTDTLLLLQTHEITLEIDNPNVFIQVPDNSLQGLDEDFYFKLVPVKEEDKKEEIEERARTEEVVREWVEAENIEVVSRPMTIETNLTNSPVTVTLPLRDIELPEGATERATFLAQLGIFIEHTNGEKEVVVGQSVTMPDGQPGIKFSIDHFSTFTIIDFHRELTQDADKHTWYIKGFPDGTFKPNQSVTRAQLAIMLARLMGYEGEQVTSKPFNDITLSHPYAGRIAFVKEYGIFQGDEQDNFRPDDAVTRAQMAVIAANYMELEIKEGIPISFTDTKQHWAKWAIEATREAGIIKGYENQTFQPNEPLTRAQAVVMLNTMTNRQPFHGVPDPSFTDVLPSHWAFEHIEAAARTYSTQ